MPPTPAQKQGMVGAGLPETEEGPLPGLVTGAAWYTEMPSWPLLVVGPEQRGAEGSWLPRNKGLR